MQSKTNRGNFLQKDLITPLSHQPLGVQIVKIWENSEKIRVSGGPLGILYNPFRPLKNFRGPTGP